MAGRREALIVAVDAYEHAALRGLPSAAADAGALAAVLGDPDVGAFEVAVVRNQPAYVVQARIEDVFADARPDDLVLLHFSGHGLKGEAGDLYFAATNTRPDRLASTAVPADFVQRCMRSSRSRSIVLLLDCCYGGAFSEGVSVRAASDLNVLESFPTGRLGGGRGRAVITASSAMEYAFEGDRLADAETRPSVFTSALVEGLTTGEADRDEDGWVSLSELYDYVFDRVREHNPNQTPSRDIEMQGDLYLARSGRRRIVPAELPPDLRTAITDGNPYTRLGAVSELAVRLLSGNEAVALGARQALTTIAEEDTRLVSEAAAAALRADPASPVPPRAPSVTRAATRAEVETEVETEVVVEPEADVELEEGSAGTSPPADRPADPGRPVEVPDAAPMEPVAPVRESAPASGADARNVRRRVAGWLALVAAAVLLAVPVLQAQPGSIEPWVESLLPLVALVGAACVLWLERARAAGAGLVLAGAATALWGAVSLVSLMVAQGLLVVGRRGVLALVVMLVLAASGAALAPVAPRAEPGSPGRTRTRIVAVTGAVGGLAALANALLLVSATDGGSSWEWLRVPALWAVVPAVGVPLISLRLGAQARGGLLAGWALAGGGYVIAFGDVQSVAALDMSFWGLAVLLLSLVVLLVAGVLALREHPVPAPASEAAAA